MDSTDVAKTSVAIVDNHEGFLSSVAQHLDQCGLNVAGAFDEVAPVLVLRPPPDVVVLDLYLGRDDRLSIPSIAALLELGSHVVLHTAAERPVQLRAAVAAGATGLALKNDGLDALAAVVTQAADGEFVCSSLLADALLTDPTLTPHLTTREIEVLQNIDDGLTQAQVARRLGISEHTVRTHLRTIAVKYVELGREVPNTLRLIREADRDGWLE